MPQCSVKAVLVSRVCKLCMPAAGMHSLHTRLIMLKILELEGVYLYNIHGIHAGMEFPYSMFLHQAQVYLVLRIHVFRHLGGRIFRCIIKYHLTDFSRVTPCGSCFVCFYYRLILGESSLFPLLCY